MNRIRPYITRAGCTLMTLCVFAIAVSTVPLIQAGTPEDDTAGHYVDSITPNGKADWTAGIVKAKGIGIPPKNAASPLQSKQMARTAAWSVALRNLLEAVRGVAVDSTTTISNYITTNDEVRTHVEGLVRGAQLVSETELPDGSYETEVKMNLIPVTKSVLPTPPTKTEPLPKYRKPLSAPTSPESFTGLVVDARGIGAKAAVAPRIMNEQGEEAYSVAYVEKRPVAEEGIVVYVPDQKTAKSHPRVTAHPLMVKALRADGANRTDLVISDADAQTIHAVPEHFKFLKRAKVLVVLDTIR